MIRNKDVTACIVTYGDRDLSQILDSLIFKNVIVWDNAKRDDYKTFGRYMAEREATTKAIYFQDDDMLVPPATQRELVASYRPGEIAAAVPAVYNPGPAYAKLTWLGWGSLHERGLPERAFEQWRQAGYREAEAGFTLLGCDIVFSMLSVAQRYDLPVTVLEYAFGSDRAYKTASFERLKRAFYDRALTLALQLGTR